MSTRPSRERLTSLEEVIKLLGDPEKIGKNMTWIGKEYSVRDLILDLQAIQQQDASVYPHATNV